MEPPLRKVLLVREAKKRQQQQQKPTFSEVVKKQPTFRNNEVECGFTMIKNWNGFTSEFWEGWGTYDTCVKTKWIQQMIEEREEREGMQKAQRDTLKFIEKL